MSPHASPAASTPSLGRRRPRLETTGPRPGGPCALAWVLASLVALSCGDGGTRALGGGESSLVDGGLPRDGGEVDGGTGLDAGVTDGGARLDGGAGVVEAVEPRCMRNGCLRELVHYGDYARSEIRALVEVGVRVDNGYSVYGMRYFTDGRESTGTVVIPYDPQKFLQRGFAENALGGYQQTAPLRIYQGDADAVVAEPYTRALVAALRDGGVSVDYQVVRGGRHTDIAYGYLAFTQSRTEESLSWPREHLEDRGIGGGQVDGGAASDGGRDGG